MEKHNIQLNYHSHAIDNKIIHNGCTLAQIWYRKPYQLLTFESSTFRAISNSDPLGGAEGRSDTRIRTWILI
jgi:hypothetical protein